MGEQVKKSKAPNMTARRRAWLREFFITWNPTEAARRAGYKHPSVMGHRLRKILAAEIEAEIAKRRMTADEVLDRMVARVRFNPAEYMEVGDDGRVYVDLDRLKADGHGQHIKGVIHTAHGDRIQFYDQQEILVHLSKVLGLEAADVKEPLEIIVRKVK